MLRNGPSKAPLPDDYGDRYFPTCLILSPTRELALQIEEDARRTEELNQMKFRFFTNVSHELRTPLTLIISPLESMIKEADDEKKAGKLKMMHCNALRLLHLVNQYAVRQEGCSLDILFGRRFIGNVVR